MPRLTPNAAPPPDYYADNLLAVAMHVWANSADVLGPARGFVQSLTQLPSQSRRLLARLVMRTTPVIRVDSLSYAEITDVGASITELESLRLITLNAAVAAEQLLQRTKVAELKALFPELVVTKDRKGDLLQRIVCTLTDTAIRARCMAQFSWVQIDPDSHLQRLQLVYFGDLYRGFTEFVMRDLWGL